MNDIHCIQFRVTGKVQGVWFRQSTVEQATELGLVGWVKNLPNGQVEGVAAGPSETLDRFKDWLWQGPPQAQVTEVLTSAYGSSDLPADFSIR